MIFQPSEAPEWLITIQDEKRAKTAGVVSDQDLPTDLPHQLFACRRALDYYVRENLVAITDQGSDNRVYDVFCVMRDNGASKEKAIELVWEHFIPHCLPEGAYDLEWVERKAENAYAYARSTEGVWSSAPIAETFADVIEKATVEYKAVAAELEPFNAFINDAVPAVEEIVEHYVEKGIPNFLAGRGGSHKSRLALQWGLSVANGAKGTQRATLVYLSSEDDKAEIIRRTQAICRRLALSADNAYFMDRRGKPSALCAMGEGAQCIMSPFYDQLVEQLNTIDGHKLVIFDSTIDFVHFLGRAKIDDGSVNYFIKTVLQRVCDETNSTLLMIWHSSKSGQDTGAGWSVSWEDAPRTRNLMKPTEAGTFELSQPKRSHGKPQGAVEMRYDNGAIVPLDAASKDVEGLKPWLIKVAISQSLINDPFQRQRNVPGWVQDHAERVFGYKPSFKQLKGILEEALRNKLLRYKNGGHGTSAGYYAFDEVPAEAIDEAATMLAGAH